MFDTNVQPSEPPTGRMWRIYACCWVTALLLLGLIFQFEGLRQGRFDWGIFLQMAKSAPEAICLALLWPLSGWLERHSYSLKVACAIHATGTALYAFLTYGLLRYLFGFEQSLTWYLWPLLYAIMSYSVVAVIFHNVRANNARRYQAKAAEQARSLLVASELDALRNKLNPHFLFNTLHSIIALTRKDSAAAETALFQFSDMLRYLLDTEKAGKNCVALDDELDFVRDYLELESIRLGPRLHIDWDLDDTGGSFPLPALSVQPLVENSIKHAFNPNARAGTLLIRSQVYHASNTLALTVADDGPGTEFAAVRRSNGLGIRTVERRLQLEYGAAGTLAIETSPGGGFSVTISVPLITG